MTLDKQIKEQYRHRSQKDSLYNSLYSALAEEERFEATKKMLSAFLSELGSKSILEIGAGHGGNVSILRDCGFSDEHVFLNELLPERISAIKNNYPEVKLYEGDALECNFEEKYDCVFQSTVFTSILRDTDRIALAGKMWSLLKPGGIILWYDFIYNNPANAGVRKVGVKEVKSLFAGAVKNEMQMITLAPPIGRRVGKFYKLFNLPILRSHLLAAFQKSPE
jgi:SAM-dependent methyltransferase